MTRTSLLRSLLILPVLLSVLLVRPEPAAACIWDWTHYFTPWPPCEVKDQPLLHRVKQTNARIAAMLFETATKIQMIKREIRQWQMAYETATRFENQLRAVYGDLTANPLPSLVHSWNRSNIGGLIQLNANGAFSLSAEVVSFQEVADSIADSFLNDVDIERIYAESWAPQMRNLRRTAEYAGTMFEQELGNLGDYRRHTEAFRDSLRFLGNRVADRYTNNAEASGDAEAYISHLSMQLSKLRGTAFQAQVASINSRLRAMEYAAEAEQLIHQNDGKRAALLGGW